MQTLSTLVQSDMCVGPRCAVYCDRKVGTPVSRWTVAEETDPDQPAIPVSKWVAQEAALQSQAAVNSQEDTEAVPPLPSEAPPRRLSTAPVSKWTLVDYDEDNPPADLDE